MAVSGAKRAHITSFHFPLRGWLGNVGQRCAQGDEEPGLVVLASLCHCAQDEDSWIGFFTEGS